MAEFLGSLGLWSFDEVSGLLGDPGGFGAVYKATGPDGWPAAVKVIGANQDERLRQREVIILEKTNASKSPRLIRMLDHGHHDSDLCIALELAQGPIQIDAAGLSEVAAVDLLLEVALALVDLHSLGILHRDLKPQNILRVGDRVVLADFGIARDAEVGTQDPTFKGWGSLHFMAPELFRGESPTVKSDLYALGVIAFKALTGECPFVGSTDEIRKGHLDDAPPPLPNGIAPSLASLVARLLAKDPHARPADARQVAERLQRMKLVPTEAEHQLASVIARGDERSANAAAAARARIAQDDAARERRIQSLFDLDEILNDALEVLRRTDDRFSIRFPAAFVGGTSRDWFGGQLRRRIEHPYGSLRLEVWDHLRGADDSGRFVIAGEVTSERTRDQQPLANLVYEDRGEGLRWFVYRFERNPLVPPRRYTLGPYDRWHGLSAHNFMDQRPYMHMSGAHIWQMKCEQLTDMLVVAWMAERLS